MGNLLFCNSNPAEEKHGTAINISEDCVARMLREEKESDKKSVAEELNIPENIDEKEWMMKLKCLDDAHSSEYGLTIQCFNAMADLVESQIEPIRELPCVSDAVVHCLQKNPCCSIKCKPIMDKYIDCIDTFRINILKEKIEQEIREKRKEEQSIVEEFLKGGDVE